MNKKQQAEFFDSIDRSDLSNIQKITVKNMLTYALLKTVQPKKIRNSKSPSLMSISAWEKTNGALTVARVIDWVESKRFCPIMVRELIEEFRIEMDSKNKQYADFRSAFKVYLIKGYLSKTAYQVALERSPHRNKTADHTSIDRRGGSL